MHDPHGEQVRRVNDGIVESGTRMPEHDQYESALASRNASDQMLRLFSPRVKFGLWRKLWLELARCQRELGLSDRIREPAIAPMQATLDDIDFAGAAEW